jgi:alkanesulfonate monooxygenase SsuD/methylene tetrahydromethanopterin reductase-like flavin-dependent oxidoreductase (luciferase family)
MKFGIFDYIDRRDEPPSKTFDERLAFLAAAENHGFYGYHLTEHHATPLSYTPSPTVYLAAAARETSRIRLGALLFLLPLYNPLRLIEELCMVDHLSKGRLDIGVGRGISPHEFEALGVTFDNADAVFEDALEVLVKGLTHETIDHHGPYLTFDDVPVPLRPCQTPHPPLWYGLRGDAHDRPARWGMNAVAIGPTDKVARHLRLYREAWARHANDPRRKASPVKDPLIGAMRCVFVADTDAEAERLAWPAFRQWFDNLAWLWVRNGTFPPIAIPADIDAARREGALIAGSPETVRRELVAQAKICGFNYLVLQLAFGSLTHAQEMHSLDLFAGEVMPALEGLDAETILEVPS